VAVALGGLNHELKPAGEKRKALALVCAETRPIEADSSYREATLL